MKKVKYLIMISVITLSFWCVISIFNSNDSIDIDSIKVNDNSIDDSEISNKNYIEDFNFVYNTLKTYYPFFKINEKKNGFDWLSNRKKYEKYISESINDEDFFNRMNDVLSDLNNLHTNLIPQSDGIFMYIIYRDFSYCDWRYDISKIYEKDKVRSRYKINKDNINKFNNINHNKELVNDPNYQNLTTDILIKDKIAYIKINSLLGELFIYNDKEILRNFLDKIKSYPYLIVDIRGNGGGDTRYWQDFLLPKIIDKDYDTTVYSFFKGGKLNKKIIDQKGVSKDINKYLSKVECEDEVKSIIKDFNYYASSNINISPSKDSIRYKGDIYLLVDEGVCSSSESLASFCKETKLAKLVGSKTGGEGLGFDPMQLDLPNTGYVLRFANNLTITESGSINELDKTDPDIKVETDYTYTSKRLIDQDIIKAVIKDTNIE